MKITEVLSEVFEWERPGIWNGGHYYGPGRLHKVTVETDEGITGYGWNGGTAAERPLNLFPGYVDYFRPLLIGRDPMETKSISDDLGEKLIKILGIGGINTQVLAAINIACWDIKGKSLGKSIHQMLGGAQQRIRTYIAGGYYAEVKIATGENGYHIAHFKTLLDHQGASILNVDVGIVPGYDVAKEVTDLAAERGVSIAPHGCQELQIHLAAAIPHGEFLEYYPVEVDPLRAEMFLPILKPDNDGYVTVPDRPGLGFELNMELLNKYRVA